MIINYKDKIIRYSEDDNVFVYDNTPYEKLAVVKSVIDYELSGKRTIDPPIKVFIFYNMNVYEGLLTETDNTKVTIEWKNHVGYEHTGQYYTSSKNFVTQNKHNIELFKKIQNNKAELKRIKKVTHELIKELFEEK